MVKDAPEATDVIQQVYTVVQGGNLVIYNATFDLQWFPNMKNKVAMIICAMRAYSSHFGDNLSQDSLRHEEGINYEIFRGIQGSHSEENTRWQR